MIHGTRRWTGEYAEDHGGKRWVKRQHSLCPQHPVAAHCWVRSAKVSLGEACVNIYRWRSHRGRLAQRTHNVCFAVAQALWSVVDLHDA